MTLRFADLQPLVQSLWTGKGSVSIDTLAMRLIDQCALVHQPSGASVRFALTRKKLDLDPQTFGETVLAPALATLKEKVGG
jgi:hypothetical protein